MSDSTFKPSSFEIKYYKDEGKRGTRDFLVKKWENCKKFQ